jgi:hypothetical protein
MSELWKLNGWRNAAQIKSGSASALDHQFGALLQVQIHHRLFAIN